MLRKRRAESPARCRGKQEMNKPCSKKKKVFSHGKAQIRKMD